MRSSSEWKETTTSRPPGLSTRSAAASAAASSIQLFIHEDAQGLKGAGGGMDPVRARVCTTRPTMSASARVVRIGRFGAGADNGAGDGAGMTLLAERSDDGGEIALGRMRHHVGCARSGVAHAHVERPIQAERKSALGLVELHRGNAEIEDNSVDRGVAEALRHRCEGGEPILHQQEAAPGRFHQIGARARSRSGRDRCR